jgi:hypothetical protein
MRRCPVLLHNGIRSRLLTVECERKKFLIENQLAITYLVDTSFFSLSLAFAGVRIPMPLFVRVFRFPDDLVQTLYRDSAVIFHFSIFLSYSFFFAAVYFF